MKSSLLLFLLVLQTLFLSAQKVHTINEDLSVIPISDKAYLHVGMLQTKSFGRVGCNGLLYISNDEAVVMDTPPDTAQTRALLSWIEKQFPGTRIKAVIVNHFHDDCLAGLPVFHQQGIPSYANQMTQALAKASGASVPQHSFSEALELSVGGEKIISRYFGEAHTRDNIVTWIPSQKMLFGGCMVKSIGSTKGNLADANEGQWSLTVDKIKKAYPDAKTIIPGHGEAGTIALLDYTIQLFRSKAENGVEKRW